jgi:hypothetical protein
MTKPGFEKQLNEGILLAVVGLVVIIVSSIIAFSSGDGDGDLTTFFRGGFGAASGAGVIMVIAGIVNMLGVLCGIKDNSIGE